MTLLPSPLSALKSSGNCFGVQFGRNSVLRMEEGVGVICLLVVVIHVDNYVALVVIANDNYRQKKESYPQTCHAVVTERSEVRRRVSQIDTDEMKKKVIGR